MHSLHATERNMKIYFPRNWVKDAHGKLYKTNALEKEFFLFHYIKIHNSPIGLLKIH